MLLTSTSKRLLRLPVLLCCVAGLALSSGCGKKETETPASLYFSLPANKVEGNAYIDRGKGLRFPLPDTQWEYRNDPRVELVFHRRDFPHMLVVESYTDYVGIPSYQRALQRMADKMRARTLEVIDGDDTAAGPREVGDMRNDVSVEGRRMRAKITLRPRKEAKELITREIDVFAKRRKRQIHLVMYVAPEDAFREHEADYLNVISNFEAF